MNDDLMNSSGYTPANEAKGSDVRAACEAAQNDWRSNQDALIHKDHNFALARCIERHVAPAIEARVQAAAVEMRERCAKIADITKVEGELDDGTVIWNMPPCCADSLGHAAGRIRALPISTDALDAMLQRGGR